MNLFDYALQETVYTVPNRGIKIAMADTNAVVGRTSHKTNTYGTLGLGNRNGAEAILLSSAKQIV